MATCNFSSNTTKSIDVGSIFLMDLSVHESDTINGGDLSSLNDDVAAPKPITTVNNHIMTATSSRDIDSLFLGGLSSESSSILSRPKIRTSYRQPKQHLLSNSNSHLQPQPPHQSSASSDSCSPSINHQNYISYHRHEIHNECLSNSLERLAQAMDNSDSNVSYLSERSKDFIETRGNLNNQITAVEPQPPPPPSELAENQSASSSLSEESFVASSNSSGSSVEDNSADDSLSTSYTASSQIDEDAERASVTTKEDSGILDVRNLDSKLGNSYDCEQDDDIHSPQGREKEKPILTNNINMASNLIKRTNLSTHNHHGASASNNKQHTARSTNRPTINGNYNSQNINNNQHHNHIDRRNQSKRSISASLPIQVPPRQLKKNLNQLKLNLINRELQNETNIAVNSNNNNNYQLSSHAQANKHSTSPGHNNERVTEVDDFDEFLEQEYNDNHHNHYPIDEYDEENLRAEENPMKLFESIQALARSLHEDAELFGSLPPKRMLESPIRSLAFA